MKTMQIDTACDPQMLLLFSCATAFSYSDSENTCPQQAGTHFLWRVGFVLMLAVIQKGY